MKLLFKIIIVLSPFVLSAQIERADSIKAATYSVKNLKANTKYQDFGSTFFGKNKIVFSSTRKGGWKAKTKSYLDLYIGDVSQSGEISNVKSFSNDVNTKYNDAFVAFSPDLKEVYYTSNSYNRKTKSPNLKIFKATVSRNGQWQNPVSLPFNSDDYDTGHPALSDDGKTLYFVSNMPGTLGDKDIFKVSVNNGHYGEPENLGPTINSDKKEYTPYIDGNIIYFSSNRKGGRGGFDIYMNKLDGSVAEPINLGAPMNSKGDDFSFIIDNEKQKGYFSSNRNGGEGDDDIYSFIQETVIPICDQSVTGVVKDAVTGFVVPNAFVALIDANGNQLRKVQTKADGSFYFGLDCASTYELEATKPGYFDTSSIVGTSNVNGYLNQAELIIEEKEFIIRNGKEMLNVENISFELNKSDIKERSKKTLGKVVRLMNKYPKMIIDFGAHNDSRGPDGLNLSLSQRRAVETITYLINQGISPERITGKGYGETRLLNKCSNGIKCTDAEHRQNKRTEFVVVKKE